MSGFTLEVGQFSSPHTFKKTNAEMWEILLWFIEDTADPMPADLTNEQQKQWVLDEARKKIHRYVRNEAKANRLAQRTQQTMATVRAEVETATDL